METTIFSKSTGEMCFSRPLLVLAVESVRRISGRAFEKLAAMVCASKSSDDSDSRLEDSSGTGMSLTAAFGVTANEQRGESVDRA